MRLTSRIAPMRWPPGKNGILKPCSLRRPPDEQTLEITLLGFVNAEMDLGQRPREDQRHRGRQTNDGQLQGREQINQAAPHTVQELNSIERRKSRNFDFSLSTIALGPLILKNQVRPSRRVHAVMTRESRPAISIVEKSAPLRFQRNDRRRNALFIDGRKAELSTPSIDVVGIASARAGKSDDGDIELAASFSRHAEAGVTHRRWRNFLPVGRYFPFDLRRARFRRRHRRRRSHGASCLPPARCKPPQPT